jgi:type I restriction enzyme S subunit
VKAVEGWKREFLGRVAQLNMGQSPDSKYYSEEENGLPFLQGCAEFEDRFPKHKMYCSQTKKLAHAGAILFSVRAPVGKINIADRDYIIGRGLAAISGIDVDQSYLEHYLIFEEQSFQNASQGSTFEAINSGELNRWPINYPTSKPEQAKIAEILSTVDRAIEQTDALIAKQQRIKTGLMQDLLTRGIDEHGNLRSEQTHLFKDSPFGRIPVEWEVKPAMELCDAVIDCKNRTPPSAKAGHPVIRTPNVRDGEFVFNDLAYTDPLSYRIWAARGKPKAGDVVITREAPIGEACLIPESLDAPCLGQRIMMYQPDVSKLLPAFMVFAIYSESLQKKMLELAGGSTVGHIRVGDIRELPIPHPKSVEEQRTIAAILSAEAAIIRKYETQRLKMKALKTALMQELLTDKKRVVELLDSMKEGAHK